MSSERLVSPNELSRQRQLWELYLVLSGLQSRFVSQFENAVEVTDDSGREHQAVMDVISGACEALMSLRGSPDRTASMDEVMQQAVLDMYARDGEDRDGVEFQVDGRSLAAARTMLVGALAQPGNWQM